jgi:hypothetical protein
MLHVCKYLEIRPSPDRSPPGPGVEKHSGQGTFSEQPDTVVTLCPLLTGLAKGKAEVVKAGKKFFLLVPT